MLRRYLDAVMRQATYEILPDDGTSYGEISGFDGVYANAPALDGCRDDLKEVLEEWLVLRISKQLPVPEVI